MEGSFYSLKIIHKVTRRDNGIDFIFRDSSLSGFRRYYILGKTAFVHDPRARHSSLTSSFAASRSPMILFLRVIPANHGPNPSWR